MLFGLSNIFTLSNKFWRIFILVFLVATGVFADENDGGLLEVAAEVLKPTQLAVGRAAVRAKADKLLTLSKEDRKDYLKKNPVPVVLGPGGRMYMVDHHHLGAAVLMAGFVKVKVKVLEDLSSLNEEQFWKAMADKNLLYLYDENGKNMTYLDLPESLREMRDDPYRSLAYFARNAGAFDKSSVLYAEFSWANFYRKYFSVERMKSLTNWDAVTQEAVAISLTAEAKGLPGYKGTGILCRAVL